MPDRDMETKRHNFGTSFPCTVNVFAKRQKYVFLCLCEGEIVLSIDTKLHEVVHSQDTKPHWVCCKSKSFVRMCSFEDLIYSEERS
jgi:hypothetical protein